MTRATFDDEVTRTAIERTLEAAKDYLEHTPAIHHAGFCCWSQDWVDNKYEDGRGSDNDTYGVVNWAEYRFPEIAAYFSTGLGRDYVDIECGPTPLRLAFVEGLVTALERGLADNTPLTYQY